MEYNKSKWELKYEKLTNGSLDKEIETIKEKLKEEAQKFNQAIQDGKNSESQKAQDEVNKLQEERKAKENIKSTITANQPKIEHILQLKKDLVKESYELLKQQKENNDYEELKQYIKDNDDNFQAITKEIVKINVKIEQLDKKLNDSNITQEEKEKITQQKEQLAEQKGQKNKLAKQYIEACRKKEEYENKEQTYNKSAVEAALAKNEKLIAKCDLIGANLIKGKGMEEIKASLKSFKFKHNKDFADKVASMRGLYEKEEKDVIGEATKEEEEAKKDAERATEIATKAKEKVETAVKAAKKAEEEFEKLNNLPVKPIPLYKKIPVVKHIVNAFSKLFNRGNKDGTTKTAEEAKAEVERTKVEAEKAKAELENAVKVAKEAEAKAKEAEKRKANVELKTEERSTEYLKKLRTKKQDEVLEGMTLYGDTFRDRLKYKMPNIKTSLTQDEIDRAKSKKNYEFKNVVQINNKAVSIEHGEDKRAYDVEARKNMIKKNIEEMRALKARKEASQDDERDI